MTQIFIELFNYKDGWRNPAPAAREEFAAAVLSAVDRQREGGIEVLSWGFNDAATDRRAPYDFHCVYLTPSADFQRGFEAEIRASGWYDHFEQVNVSGAVSTPEALLRAYARLETRAAGPT